MHQVAVKEVGWKLWWIQLVHLQTVHRWRLNTAIQGVHRPHTTQVTACAFVQRQHGIKMEGYKEETVRVISWMKRKGRYRLKTAVWKMTVGKTWGWVTERRKRCKKEEKDSLVLRLLMLQGFSWSGFTQTHRQRPFGPWWVSLHLCVYVCVCVMFLGQVGPWNLRWATAVPFSFCHRHCILLTRYSSSPHPLQTHMNFPTRACANGLM